MKTGLKRSLLTLFILYGYSIYAQKLTKPASTPRLHVIYMLEQEDPALGLLNLRNDELMTQITKTVEWALGYPMQLTYLSKSDFTKAALSRTIASLKTRPRDIIILYYSGFGVISTKNTSNFASWKLHDVPSDGLPVSEVEKWLSAKKVHLSLLLADCNAQYLINDLLLGTVIGQPDKRKQVIQRLFLGTCGLVKMGSSLPLAPSWTDANKSSSAFTNSLNSAFQDLLLTNTPDKIASVSFQELNSLTEKYLKQNLFGKPFNQSPVLEIKSCQNAARQTVLRATIDPLATETLNSLLNAVAVNQDSLQRISFRDQLLDVSQDDATVVVSRFFLPSDSFIWTEEPKLRQTYTLKNYLDQFHKPLSYVEDGKLYEFPGILKTIAITEKEVDKSAPKPLKSLTIREEYNR